MAAFSHHHFQRAASDVLDRYARINEYFFTNSHIANAQLNKNISISLCYIYKEC